MRILIVSYYFPPLNHVASLRAYSWAKRWHERGAKVTVLTAQKRDFDGLLDSKLILSPGIRVIEVRYVSLKVRLRAIIGVGRLRSILAEFYRKFFARGRGPINWFSAWLIASKGFMDELAFNHDVVVSTFAPKECHLIANELKLRNPALLWVSDYRDLWHDTYTVNRDENTIIEEGKLEQQTVGVNSDVVTTVSADFRTKLHGRFLKPTYEVKNGFFIEDADGIDNWSKGRLTNKAPLKIVYTGTMYQSFMDPSVLVDTLVRLLDSGLLSSKDVILEVYSDSHDFLLGLMKRPGYDTFILPKGVVNRSDALRAQRQADILLLLESSDEKACGVLTGKVFEYLVSGRPILCIGSRPSFELGTLLRDTGTGVVFGPDEIYNLPDYILSSLKGNGIFLDFNPARDEILKYSREHSADLLFSVICEQLADRIHGSC